MPVLTFLPSGKTLEVDETTTIREASHVVGVNLHDRCGGLGACCNCVVKIVQGRENLNPKTIVEQAVFSMAPDERLSCQCRLQGDVTIESF